MKSTRRFLLIAIGATCLFGLGLLAGVAVTDTPMHAPVADARAAEGSVPSPAHTQVDVEPLADDEAIYALQIIVPCVAPYLTGDYRDRDGTRRYADRIAAAEVANACLEEVLLDHIAALFPSEDSIYSRAEAARDLARMHDGYIAMMQAAYELNDRARRRPRPYREVYKADTWQEILEVLIAEVARTRNREGL